MRFLSARFFLTAAALTGILYGTCCRAEEEGGESASTQPREQESGPAISAVLLEEILRAAFPSLDDAPSAHRSMRRTARDLELEVAAFDDENDEDEDEDRDVERPRQQDPRRRNGDRGERRRDDRGPGDRPRGDGPGFGRQPPAEGGHPAPGFEPPRRFNPQPDNPQHGFNPPPGPGGPPVHVGAPHTITVHIYLHHDFGGTPPGMHFGMGGGPAHARRQPPPPPPPPRHHREADDDRDDDDDGEEEEAELERLRDEVASLRRELAELSALVRVLVSDRK